MAWTLGDVEADGRNRLHVGSSESWGPKQHPLPWHSCAGGGAVHSINNGRVRNIGRVTRLVGLGAGELDHLTPLLGLIGDELAEVGGRARKHSAALIGNPRLDLRIG